MCIRDRGKALYRGRRPAGAHLSEGAVYHLSGKQILFGTVQAAENSSPQPKAVLEDQLLWEKDLAKKCKRPPFASIEQAANNYQCLCNEIYKRIRSLTGTTERPVR